MNTWELVLLSLGLAMDAAAVSMTNGMCIKGANYKHGLIMGAAFGLFQGVMPAIGYLAGTVFSNVINKIDHWIALILLGFIGGKMIYEALTKEVQAQCMHCLTFRLLIAQAIATSIDALAVGISFAALQVTVVSSCCIIAFITFLCSFLAMLIGKKFGNMLSSKSEIIGGVVLIAIGLKIFIEHIGNF